jgi:hypothetical protein
MRPSALSAKLDQELLDFAWDEWAQMGVLAAAGRQSPWAQDPEALVIFTLEVARDDPRLFDEVLDWLAVNEPLVNMRRLKSMCEGEEDELLSLGTLFWLDSHRRSKPVPSTKTGDPKPLFRGLSTAIEDPDPAFAAVGRMRPEVAPSGKSGTPDMRAPIDFAFRLRQLLGVNARAEVVRYLLTTAPADADTAAITRSTGFASRNVRQALASLQDAGVVSRRGKRRYAIDYEGWTGLLRIGPDELPTYRAWPQLLGGLRKVARWLRRQELDGLSDYMLGSEARDLLEDVRDQFEEAGFEVGRSPAAGAWGDLDALLEEALASLD